MILPQRAGENRREEEWVLSPSHLLYLLFFVAKDLHG